MNITKFFGTNPIKIFSQSSYCFPVSNQSLQHIIHLWMDNFWIFSDHIDFDGLNFTFWLKIPATAFKDSKTSDQKVERDVVKILEKMSYLQIF